LERPTDGGPALERARRRAINLPWWALGIGSFSWLSCVPVFLAVLRTSPERLDERIYVHLPISLLIACLIGITHAFFATELASLRWLFPVLFQNARPADTPGTWPLTLAGRGLLLAVAAGICPIVSLLLLTVAPANPEQGPWFALSVGCVGIFFGVFAAWMLSRIVTRPVQELRRSAKQVARGNLDTRVEVLRADEFGPLIDEFNRMISGLRDKARLQETFGRHVGREAAQLILQRDPGLGGTEQNLTVMFADIRDFTARCDACTPRDVVRMLNTFLTEMVRIVEEEHGGMVNKFVGDGLMALFGAGDITTNHAEAAVHAGRRMVDRLEDLNRQLTCDSIEPLAMGIGIHTGSAVVGSIGSPQRLEFTAIGDTVNVASRIEALTKPLAVPLLFSAATRRALPEHVSVSPLPPQRIKGKPEPIEVYTIR
jgi:adenylate cyclase